MRAVLIRLSAEREQKNKTPLISYNKETINQKIVGVYVYIMRGTQACYIFAFWIHLNGHFFHVFTMLLNNMCSSKDLKPVLHGLNTFKD